ASDGGRGTETPANVSEQSGGTSGYTVNNRIAPVEHVRQVEAAAKAEASRLRNAPRVVVHPEAAAIPDGALRSVVLAEDAKGAGVVDAFYDPRNGGTIHLIANRLRDSAHASEKVRHEGFHAALRTNAEFRAEYELLLVNM